MKKILVATALGLSLVSSVAWADFYGNHPAYMHAISDLRAAKWMLENRPGGIAVSEEEGSAIQQINAAIGDIKTAAAYDGKNLNYTPGPDVPNDRPGRLHEALRLVKQAHSDVAKEEDDPASQGLQYRSLKHIDAAKGAIDQAIYAAEHNM